MSEPIRRAWLRGRVPLWALMMLPVASPVFMWLSPLQRREREARWNENPLISRFQPEDGARVSWGDDLLLKLAFSSGPDQFGDYEGSSWWLAPERTIHEERLINGFMFNGEWPASAEGLARLPALLRDLPPSDRTAGPVNCVLVAFPVKGRWVVRTYRRDPMPKEVEAFARGLGFWKP